MMCFFVSLSENSEISKTKVFSQQVKFLYRKIVVKSIEKFHPKNLNETVL